MRIGFAGAHRTGKTTLANAVAKHFGHELTAGSCTPAFVNSGKKPSDDMSYTDRFVIQQDILERYKASVEGKEVVFIDRTGLDFMAYTSAEMNTKEYATLSEETISAIGDYLNDCLMSVDGLDAIFIVPPGIQIVHDETKAICDDLIIESINALIVGYAEKVTTTNVYLLDRSVLLLEDRVKVVVDIIQSTLLEVTE